LLYGATITLQLFWPLIWVFDQFVPKFIGLLTTNTETFVTIVTTVLP